MSSKNREPMDPIMGCTVIAGLGLVLLSVFDWDWRYLVAGVVVPVIGSIIAAMIPRRRKDQGTQDADEGLGSAR